MEVEIDEYRNGKYVRTWPGVSSCAKSHSVSYEVIKCLVATGNALYWEDEDSITFDLPQSSPYRYEMRYMTPRDKRKRAVLVYDEDNDQA